MFLAALRNQCKALLNVFGVLHTLTKVKVVGFTRARPSELSTLSGLARQNIFPFVGASGTDGNRRRPGQSVVWSYMPWLLAWSRNAKRNMALMEGVILVRRS